MTAQLSPEAKRELGDKVNQAYSLLGARTAAADAGKVGTVSLDSFDAYEMQKMYGNVSVEELRERLQRNAEADAADRLARLEADNRRRAEFIGGLAWRGVLRPDELTDYDALPAEVLADLPWHLPQTGPAGNGVTWVRPEWTPEEALDAAGMLDWNVRKATSRWTTRDGQHGRSAHNKFLIVRDPVDRYAERCRCADYHGRDGEETHTVDPKTGKRTRKDPCPWTVEWDLGQCGTQWNPEVQNEDLISILAAFTEDGHFHPESAGWLSAGSRVFVQMKLSETRFVLGADPTSLYLGVHNNFSGAGSLRLGPMIVRDACDNTYKQSEHTALGMAKVTHVGDVEGRAIEAGREALTALGFLDDYARDMEALARIQLSTADLATFADAMVNPKAPNTQAEEWRTNRRLALISEILGDQTVPAELRSTGFGAVQAVNRFFTDMTGFNRPRTAQARFNAATEPDGDGRQATRKAQAVINKIAKAKVQVVRP
jgi:hypothetical protein